MLHMAAFAGDPNMVNELLKARAEVNAQNDDGNTSLHCECTIWDTRVQRNE